MKSLTITVENIPEDLFETMWAAAIKNAPTKILKNIKGGTIHMDVVTMPNTLANPLAEMLILATTLAAIDQYQKEKN